MSFWTELRTPTERELLVGIYDLTQYTLFSERTAGMRVLEIMAGYHGLIARIIEDAGGIFIKPIGDAGLFAFPAEQADEAVNAIHVMLDKGDAWLAAEGYPGRARVGIHVGPVAIGRIGAQGREWLDIIGKTVNIVVVMQSYRFTMTPAAFRALSPPLRKKFKKHTPPASYIGENEPRPRAYWRGYERGVTP
jgi:adenylate cyclase